MGTSNVTVQTFSNDIFGNIRVIEKNGETLFCGSDVAKALGYARPADAISAHCKGVCVLPTPSAGGVQNTKFITEGDVYRLIASSKLPTAQKFEHWIFDEVIPTIRKTGGYVNNVDLFVDSYMSGMDKTFQDMFKLMMSGIIQQNEIIDKQRKKIEEDKPLVEFADHVSNTSSLIDVGELSKIARKENINIGRTKLFQWLRDNNYLMNNENHKNQPYQKYIDQGLFQLREYTYDTPYGVQAGLKTYVTGKGQIYFIEKLRDRFPPRIKEVASSEE